MTTTNDPEAIRAEIDRTRGRLSEDVDVLTESVRPSSVAKRTAQRATGRAGRLKESVMGTAHDTTSAGADKAHDVAERRQGALPTWRVARPAATPSRPVRWPWPPAGWWVRSCPPAPRSASSPPRPRRRPSRSSTRRSRWRRRPPQDLKEPAQQAAQSVKETAQQGVEHVRDDGTSAVQDVKETASGTAESGSSFDAPVLTGGVTEGAPPRQPADPVLPGRRAVPCPDASRTRRAGGPTARAWPPSTSRRGGLSLRPMASVNAALARG